MILPDTNVLLYATNPAVPDHDCSLAWLETALGGRETVGFTWVVLLGFLRIATSPKVFPSPMSVEEAQQQISRWLSAPASVVVEPADRHIKRVGDLLGEAGRGGELVPDAHLAALALENSATVASFDRDFQRFADVRSFVPS